MTRRILPTCLPPQTRTAPSPLLASRVTGVVITIYIAFSTLKVQLGEEGNAAVRAPAKSAGKPEEAETSAA